jgi:hypothetical protein
LSTHKHPTPAAAPAAAPADIPSAPPVITSFTMSDESGNQVPIVQDADSPTISCQIGGSGLALTEFVVIYGPTGDPNQYIKNPELQIFSGVPTVSAVFPNKITGPAYIVVFTSDGQLSNIFPFTVG